MLYEIIVLKLMMHIAYYDNKSQGLIVFLLPVKFLNVNTYYYFILNS